MNFMLRLQKSWKKTEKRVCFKSFIQCPLGFPVGLLFERGGSMSEDLHSIVEVQVDLGKIDGSFKDVLKAIGTMQTSVSDLKQAFWTGINVLSGINAGIKNNGTIEKALLIPTSDSLNMIAYIPRGMYESSEEEIADGVLNTVRETPKADFDVSKITDVDFEYINSNTIKITDAEGNVIIIDSSKLEIIKVDSSK